jgi:hypothetical protein
MSCGAEHLNVGHPKIANPRWAHLQDKLLGQNIIGK